MENVRKPAGFWRRVASFVIDLFLSSPIFYACMQLQGHVMQEVVFTVILVVLYTVFLSSNWRATPGMRLTKVEAYGANGEPLSKAHAVYWCVASSVFAMMAFAPLLYLQWWMEQYDIAALISALQTGKIDYATYAMELQANTGLNPDMMQGLILMCTAASLVLCLIWAMSVVLSKRKVGWHNWLSATRFVVRTEA